MSSGVCRLPVALSVFASEVPRAGFGHSDRSSVVTRSGAFAESACCVARSSSTCLVLVPV